MPHQVRLLSDIIYWHHKITPFVPSAVADEQYAAAVNAVRLADHIDASMGFISKGMPHSHIHAVMAKIPEAGFHLTLLNFLPRIRGWNIPKAVWELSSIIKW